MFKTLLLLVLIAATLFTIGINIYASALDKQIIILREKQELAMDSIAYYRCEYVHSTSGTRRHVGAALGKVISRLSLHKELATRREIEIKELVEQRKSVNKYLW